MTWNQMEIVADHEYGDGEGPSLSPLLGKLYFCADILRGISHGGFIINLTSETDIGTECFRLSCLMFLDGRFH